MSKLTLSVDASVIAQAKQYAKTQGISLSSLIQSYLAALSDPVAKGKSTPVLQSLRGSLKGTEKADYGKYLLEKYK